FDRVRLDGLEQAVATVVRVAHDEALVDERGEGAGDVEVVEQRLERLGGRQVERGREHAEMSQYSLLGLVEQVVAPADGGVHRPMSQLAAGGSGRHAPLAAGDEAAAELVETPTAELTGSQLERQREPVEPVAEVGDAWVGDVPHRPRLGLTG